MPNQATRRRRQQAGLPSNLQKIHEGNDDEATILASRFGPRQVASSRFLLLGNSPDVLMSWLAPFMNSETGFRLDYNPTYTVWIYDTAEEASYAVQQFNTRTMKIPEYVPDRIRHMPLFLMDVVRPNANMLK